MFLLKENKKKSLQFKAWLIMILGSKYLKTPSNSAFTNV